MTWRSAAVSFAGVDAGAVRGLKKGACVECRVLGEISNAFFDPRQWARIRTPFVKSFNVRAITKPFDKRLA